ncbi:hypothetical protein FA15DRAFT_571942, partial [Coprinopsis marcescibilis]
PIIHVPSNISALLDTQPKSKTKAVLVAALHKADAKNKVLKQCVVKLQASNLLNETYCNKLRFQLMAKEKAKTKGNRGKLFGNGLLLMLTSNKFYERMVQFTEWQR